MPKYIPKKDVFRLFPHRFFEELETEMPSLIPMNVAFLAKGTKYDKKKKHPKIEFDKNRQKVYSSLIERNNLHTFNQGTFLVLETFVNAEDRINAIKGKPVKRQMLLAQYITADNQPLFTKATPLSAIKQTSLFHADNDRLVLAFMETVRDKETTKVSNMLHVIKGPTDWLNQINGPWQWLDKTATQSD